MEYWEWIYECCPKTGFLIKSIGLRLRIVVLLQASKPGYRGGLGTKLLSCLHQMYVAPLELYEFPLSNGISTSSFYVTICNTYRSLPDLFPMTLDQTHRSRQHSEGSKQRPTKATRVGM